MGTLSWIPFLHQMAGGLWFCWHLNTIQLSFEGLFSINRLFFAKIIRLTGQIPQP